MSTPAMHVIEKFGGIRPMSRKTGWPPSTIQHWYESGLIPAKRQPQVLEKARECGIDMTIADFFAAEEG